MILTCCKCGVEIGEAEGGGGAVFSFCDRYIKVAALEMDLERAEANTIRSKHRVEALDTRLGNCKDPVYRSERESELEHWTETAEHIRGKISKLLEAT